MTGLRFYTERNLGIPTLPGAPVLSHSGVLSWDGRSCETSRRDPSGAGARAWRATSGCSLTGWKNDFQRFPTHVAVARASEFVLGKGAGA